MAEQNQTTKAEQLAQAVWKAGNRHGSDAERKAEILRLCTEALGASERLRSALLVAKEFASWPAGAAELKRVHATIDAALSGTEQ